VLFRSIHNLIQYHGFSSLRLLIPTDKKFLKISWNFIYLKMTCYQIYIFSSFSIFFITSSLIFYHSPSSYSLLACLILCWFDLIGCWFDWFTYKFIVVFSISFIECLWLSVGLFVELEVDTWSDWKRGTISLCSCSWMTYCLW